MALGAQTGANAGISYVYGNDVLDKKANNSAVNALYKSYFGRDANQSELNNWGDLGGATVKDLENLPAGDEIYINGWDEWHFPYGCGHTFKIAEGV
jgi:hypothetical protein